MKEELEYFAWLAVLLVICIFVVFLGVSIATGILSMLGGGV